MRPAYLWLPYAQRGWLHYAHYTCGRQVRGDEHAAAGSLSDRFGRRNVLLACFAVFLVAYLGFAISSAFAVLAAMFVLYGVYQGIFRAVGRAFASDFAPEPLRASGIGWYSATVGLLQLVASLVAGILWDHIGHSAVFYYGAVFAVVGIVALVALIPGARRLR